MDHSFQYMHREAWGVVYEETQQQATESCH
jgi:hypothetical protein